MTKLQYLQTETSYNRQIQSKSPPIKNSSPSPLKPDPLWKHLVLNHFWSEVSLFDFAQINNSPQKEIT